MPKLTLYYDYNEFPVYRKEDIGNYQKICSAQGAFSASDKRAETVFQILQNGKSGTKMITRNKTYDPNGDIDEEYFEFGLFMSRREYKTINRRLLLGRQTSTREGKYSGARPPLGYRIVKLQKKKRRNGKFAFPPLPCVQNSGACHSFARSRRILLALEGHAVGALVYGRICFMRTTKMCN